MKIKKISIKIFAVLLAFMVACVGLPVSASTNYIAFGEDLEELAVVRDDEVHPGVELTWYGTFRTYTVDDYYGEGMPDERIGITLVIEKTDVNWEVCAGEANGDFTYGILVTEPSGLPGRGNVSGYEIDQPYIWDRQWFEFMDESTATVTASGNLVYAPWDQVRVFSYPINSATFEAYYIMGTWYDYWIS